MKRIVLPLLLLFFLLFHGYPQSILAYVAGGAGSATLAPASSAWQTGETSDVAIQIKSGTAAISSVAVRVNIPVISSDIEVTGIDTNTALSEWSFPVKTASVVGNSIQVDIMALNTSVSGATIATPTTLATIHIRALKAFSAKTITFDTSVSKMYKKSPAEDILGTLSGGSYNA